MSRPPEPSLDQGFRVAYLAGLVLCLGWPLALQLLLGTFIPRGLAAPGPALQQLGYTFTGLTCACALYVLGRRTRIRAGFRSIPTDQRGRVLTREILLYSILFQLSAVFGILYYVLGGPQAERFARGFVALTPVMFFVFVPRLQSWRDAAQGE